MSLVEDQNSFYRERIPQQFNQTFAAQQALARADGDIGAKRLFEEMETVRASIVVQVDGGDAILQHLFEIDRGKMSHVEASSHPPFLILGHSLDDFENLRRECGDSLLGFLGGLAGLGEEIRLTSQRVRSLRELAGSVVFERVGSGGFTLFAHFGVEAPSPEPDATIRLDKATYEQLRTGRLDPQEAFMDGHVEILGDEGIAIGLALAALSPD